jgi:hypothetical protein
LATAEPSSRSSMDLVSERALRTTWKPQSTCSSYTWSFLQDPLTTGAPGVTLLHAGGVGVANSPDDMLGVVRAADAWCVRYRVPIGAIIGASSFSSHKKCGSWRNCQDLCR